MEKDISKVGFKAKLVLAKYEDGVTQEDIDSGIAKPIEIIESEDILYLTEEQIKELNK